MAVAIWNQNGVIYALINLNCSHWGLKENGRIKLNNGHHFEIWFLVLIDFMYEHICIASVKLIEGLTDELWRWVVIRFGNGSVSTNSIFISM